MLHKKISTLNFKFYSTRGVLSPRFSFAELYSYEHFDEIRQRSFYTLSFLFFTTTLVFSRIKIVVKILENSVSTIQFFQSSPDEYFLSTFIIAFSTGLIICIPFIFSQIIFFFRPALNINEKLTVNFLLISSIILFFIGIGFSYYILIPAALNFFIFYSADVLEPFLAFEEYYSFVAGLFLSTGVVFQLPIVQIILSLTHIINPKIMLSFWRTILLFSTILGAVLTPSADPITQLLLSLALFFLYFIGTITSIYLDKK